MTDERLAELRMWANGENSLSARGQRQYLAEIDRLRAELAAKDAEIEQTEMSLTLLLDFCYCSETAPDCLSAGPLDPGAHDHLCARRIAYDALNPEAAP